MKPVVLMLGWEFPPYINGGLGLACQGIGEALAQYLNVTMVIPRTTVPDEPGGMGFVGLDTLNDPEPALQEEVAYPAIGKHLRHMKIERVHADISLYRRPDQILVSPERLYQPSRKKGKQVPPTLSNPSGKTLYGSDLIGEIIAYANKASALAPANGFDIIHAHDWMTFWAGLELRTKSGKPLVLHIHSTEYDRMAGTAYRNDVFSLEKHACEQADHVIAVSEYTAGVLQSVYGISATKITVIHNGISPVSTYRRKRAFPEKLVSFAGRITRQKGPARFLDMALRILERRDDVRFVMAGKGDLLPDMIDAVAMLGIGDRFHFTGFLDREKLHDLFAMSNVCVMPSVSEPFGLVPLEAIQFDVPVVLSTESGVREVLPMAPHASFDDPEALADQVCQLFDDRKQTGLLLTQLQEQIKTLTWDQAALKIIRLYDILN